MEKIKILVACHKNDNCIKTESPYYPIQVGASLHTETDLGFQKDNEGDNISEKNQSWCELTAIYWGWKNIKDCEYIGLCHYRRYFDADITGENIDELMKGKDIILIQSVISSSKLRNSTGLKYAASQEDFWLYADTFLGIHPEYRESFIKYYFNYNRFHPYTMFIARKEIFDDFCEFIFPVFFELEKRLKPHNYSRQKRFIAYCGEWSLGLYVVCRSLKVRELPLLMYQGDVEIHLNKVRNLITRIHNILLYQINNITINRRNKMIVPPDVKLGLINDGITLNNV